MGSEYTIKVDLLHIQVLGLSLRICHLIGLFFVAQSDSLFNFHISFDSDVFIIYSLLWSLSLDESFGNYTLEYMYHQFRLSPLNFS